jgi:hypothetical protein
MTVDVLVRMYACVTAGVSRHLLAQEVPVDLSVRLGSMNYGSAGS